MKKHLYIIGVTIFVALITTIVMLSKKIESITADRDRLSTNQSALMSSLDTFKTKEGLSAIKVKALTLTVNEYKKYRSDDARIIKTLNADINRLQKVGSIQAQTIYNLRSTVKDSIVYRDNIVIDTLQCVSYSNQWLDFTGCYNKQKEFEGVIESRDSLIYVEHIVPKRFLGFLWKYGCK